MRTTDVDVVVVSAIEFDQRKDVRTWIILRSSHWCYSIFHSNFYWIIFIISFWLHNVLVNLWCVASLSPVDVKFSSFKCCWLFPSSAIYSFFFSSLIFPHKTSFNVWANHKFYGKGDEKDSTTAFPQCRSKTTVIVTTTVTAPFAKEIAVDVDNVRARPKRLNKTRKIEWEFFSCVLCERWDHIKWNSKQ